MTKPFVIKMKDLESRQAMRFNYVQKGVKKEGFALVFKGQIRAYENRCRHLALPLDYGDGMFFDPEGSHLFCHNHGAIFDPLTGQCLRGPCLGESLTPIPIQVAGDEVQVSDLSVTSK